jgi:hypothetical protein
MKHVLHNLLHLGSKTSWLCSSLSSSPYQIWYIHGPASRHWEMSQELQWSCSQSQAVVIQHLRPETGGTCLERISGWEASRHWIWAVTHWSVCVLPWCDIISLCMLMTVSLWVLMTMKLQVIREIQGTGLDIEDQGHPRLTTSESLSRNTRLVTMKWLNELSLTPSSVVSSVQTLG